MKDKNACERSLKSFAETGGRETGPLLDAIRSREVAALTHEQARQQTLALFALRRPGFNQAMSGLVKQHDGFRELELYLQARIRADSGCRIETQEQLGLPCQNLYCARKRIRV